MIPYTTQPNILTRMDDDATANYATNQTEVAILKDETENVSCFNRAVKQCYNVLPILRFTGITILTAGLSGMLGVMSGGLHAYSQSTNGGEIIEGHYNMSGEEYQKYKRSIELINDNCNLILYAAGISSGIVGAGLYMLNEWLKLLNEK